MEFLNTRCEFLEALQPTLIKLTPAKVSIQKANQTTSSKNHGATLAHLATNEADECMFCKQAHRIHACKIFKDLSLNRIST